MHVDPIEEESSTKLGSSKEPKGVKFATMNESKKVKSYAGFDTVRSNAVGSFYASMRAKMEKKEGATGAGIVIGGEDLDQDD